MNISEVELLTRHLEETEKFYSNILGLDLVFNDETRLTFNVGNSRLTFIKTNAQEPVYHFAFEIPYNLLDQAIQWISQKINLITQPNGSVIADFDTWNAKSVYFFDNNGNILEFIIRYNNKIKSEKTFDTGQIVRISEIAFVSENIESLANELHQKYELSYFTKQEPKEDFSAIGDEDGLFILSAEYRHWFATDIEAKKFWTKVKFENKGKLLEFEHV